MPLSLDATYSLGRDLSGVGVYSREILWGLAANDPLRPLRFLYRPHRFGKSLVERLPRNVSRWPLLDRWGPRGGIFHGLNQRLPARRFAQQVATFHDLFVLSGEYSTPAFRERFAAQARYAAAEADRIIAVSHFTARQVHDLLEVPLSRIRVVHHGVRKLPLPEATREDVVLHVGAIQKRKNLLRLVEAFRAVPAPWRLVLAGSLGFEAAAVQQAIAESPVRDRIELTGYQDSHALAGWYARARLFAFPSLDEGFGMPVLEAMAAGVPVIASTSSALPEVCGEASLSVEPGDADALATALLMMTGNEDLRARYESLGYRRAALFTWEKAVEGTEQVYRELLPGSAILPWRS